MKSDPVATRKLFEQLSGRLAEEIDRVAEELGLDPKRLGRRYVCVPPWGSTKNRKLEIVEATGGWKCWNTGQSGDALGLVGCVLTNQPNMRTREARREGIRWAKARYGVDGETFDQTEWDRKSEEIKARQAQKRRDAAAELKRNRNTAQHLFIQADDLRPTTRTRSGCDGARYLEARGIDFDVLGRLPRAVKLSPREHWVLKEDGEIVQEHYGPALVSAMILPDNSFASVHRIWIDPVRPGEKADLDPPRKMWPSSDGAAIRLWRGEHQLSETDMTAKGLSCPLVVCEGVEDGLSIAMMTPEFRVHAAGSLPGLAAYTPPACASEIIVAADNDWNKPQAQAQLAKAVERLRGFGKPLKVVRSPEGKDFNDLLKGDE